MRRMLPTAVLACLIALVLSVSPASANAQLRSYAGPCLAAIIDHENPGWDPRKWNTAGSGAYGLPQALPASKMRTAGHDWRTNPYTQIRWMRGYVRSRYGSECSALHYWLTHKSY